MNEINTDFLLSQIRALGAELQAPASMPAQASDAPAFASLLKNTLDTVNATQQTAKQMSVDFEMGNTDKTLAEVMVAAQKADLSFRAMTEVRNKLVNAYQEIMNMPV